MKRYSLDELQTRMDFEKVAFGKNYIINGNMQIDDYVLGSVTTSKYVCNRWFSFISGTSNVNRIGQLTVNQAYLQLVVGAGTDTCTAEQRVENPWQFSGKTMTLQYYLFGAYATANNVRYAIALNHAGGRTVLTTNLATIGVGTKTVTFTIPDLSSYTFNASSFLEIRPVEIINTGVTGVLGLSSVKLEEGSVATPWTPYEGEFGGEIQACQRYLPIASGYYAGYAATNNEVYLSIPSNLPARIAPTGISYTLGGSIFYTNIASSTTNIVFFAGDVRNNTLKIRPTGTPLTVGQGVMVNLPKILFTGCEL